MWSGLPFPPPRNFPFPGVEPGLLKLLHCRGSIYHWVAVGIKELACQCRRRLKWLSRQRGAGEAIRDYGRRNDPAFRYPRQRTTAQGAVNTWWLAPSPSWKWKCESLSSVRFFATSWKPPVSSVPEILGLPFPSPGHLPDSGIEPGSLALQADSLPSEPPGKPLPLLGISLICRSVLHSWVKPEIPCLFPAHRWRGAAGPESLQRRAAVGVGVGRVACNGDKSARVGLGSPQAQVDAP